MTPQTQILLATIAVAAIVLAWVVADHLLTRPTPETPGLDQRPVDGDTTPLTVGRWLQ